MDEVLITGGAGYIGSTIASCCDDAGIRPVILDDLSTGSREFAERFDFYEGDVADEALVNRLFDEHPGISAVIHCAAKIIVPESVAEPLDYYENNVAKGIVLARTLAARGVRRFILSSTAAVYDASGGGTVDEESLVTPGSPYAASKWMLERVLQDAAAAGALRAISLRYFNPIGADPMRRTGLQNPFPTHALGQLMGAHRQGNPFSITGTNWPTRDGSGIRDYIHVWDLARAHVAAVQRIDEVTSERSFEVINLGTGVGTTVFELVGAFEDVAGGTVEIERKPPRPGDQAGCVPSVEKAERLLGWHVDYDVRQGIRDAIAWAAKRTSSADPQSS